MAEKIFARFLLSLILSPYIYITTDGWQRKLLDIEPDRIIFMPYEKLRLNLLAGHGSVGGCSSTENVGYSNPTRY